jgi:hypothetical protein
MLIEAIQDALRERQIEAQFFYDHHSRVLSRTVKYLHETHEQLAVISTRLQRERHDRSPP